MYPLWLSTTIYIIVLNTVLVTLFVTTQGLQLEVKPVVQVTNFKQYDNRYINQQTLLFAVTTENNNNS